MVAEMMGRGPLLSPGLDATGGRSYLRSSQTPGALSGRRAVQRWYTSGIISGDLSGQIVKSVGGTWRLLGASARVRIAPTSTLVLDILAKVPGGSYTSIFQTTLSIASGQLEATLGTLLVDHLYPVGTLWSVDRVSGSDGTDLTIELHYKVLPVGQ